MRRQLLLSVALALSSAAGAIAQAASTTAVPLDNFLRIATSAVGVINSAVSQQTAASSSSSSPSLSSSTSSPTTASATPTQPAPAASSSAAAAPPKHSNSRRNLIITVVCCIAGALLLIAAILTCVFCCLRRRHRHSRKQAIIPAKEDEKSTFHSTPPLNPGRTYSPHSPQNRVPSMEHQPAVPILASATNPGAQQHPPHRAQNPFVPVPPSPRGQEPLHNGSAGSAAHHLIAPPITTTTTTKTYPEAQALGTASRSPSRPRSRSPILPTHATAERHSDPFGLSGIGRPYEDMHVHTLQTDEPSPELRYSLQNREPIQRQSTSPLVPSRSPHRHSGAFGTTDSTYHSFSGDSSSSTNGSGSGEEWRRSQTPQREQRQQRLSDTAISNGLPTPPVPWDDGYGRRHSGGRVDSPRNGNGQEGNTGWIGGGGQDRRGSSSPATGTSGTPRRLRFSDVPPTMYGDEPRYSHGVGEAL